MSSVFTAARPAVYFLGIDVSKRQVNVSLVDERGVEQFTDKVLNNAVDLAASLPSST